MQFATISAAGPRSRNEDAFCVRQLDDDFFIVAIADGLGGHAGGDVAANHAVQRFVEMVSANRAPDLIQIGTTIHTELKDMQSLHPELQGMSTTLSAGYFLGTRFSGIHCGDTRISVNRGTGIKKLTEDHTEVERLLRTGQLSREAARTYTRRNVLDSALGANVPLRLDQIDFEALPGDRFFFTTDGAHGKVLLREMRRISEKYVAANELVLALANEIENRNPTDNYTIVCCFIS
ncbi:PP2C family protein-serine/threonine phosphatase [Belnapia rosea]|uniref:PP2C family protein-serine/threonine phosphatase n=1 Tax=Belnapia rosea TaxID=938405 RepID=UPI001C40B6A9|nr:protein phosphatase 2C domain-containing protein [Belnapia rosea]